MIQSATVASWSVREDSNPHPPVRSRPLYAVELRTRKLVAGDRFERPTSSP